MISSKAKVRPMVLTSHNVQTAMMRAQIGRVPEADRTPKQKKFMVDALQEERGIITVHDIHEARSAMAEKSAAVAPVVSPVEVKKTKVAKSGKKKTT